MPAKGADKYQSYRGGHRCSVPRRQLAGTAFAFAAIVLIESTVLVANNTGVRRAGLDARSGQRGAMSGQCQAEAIKLICISQNFNDRRARAAHSD